MNETTESFSLPSSRQSLNYYLFSAVKPFAAAGVALGVIWIIWSLLFSVRELSAFMHPSLTVAIPLGSFALSNAIIYLSRSRLSVRRILEFGVGAIIVTILCVCILLVAPLPATAVALLVANGVAVAFLELIWADYSGYWWRTLDAQGIFCAVGSGAAIAAFLSSFPIFAFQKETNLSASLVIALPFLILSAGIVLYPRHITEIPCQTKTAKDSATTLGSMMSPIVFFVGVSFGLFLIAAFDTARSAHVQDTLIISGAVGLMVGAGIMAAITRTKKRQPFIRRVLKFSYPGIIAAICGLALAPSEYAWISVALGLGCYAAIDSVNYVTLISDIKRRSALLFANTARGRIWLSGGICVGITFFYVLCGIIGLDLRILSLACVLLGLLLLNIMVIRLDDTNSVPENVEPPAKIGPYQLRCQEIAERYNLTTQEAKVMEQVGKGRTAKYIADEMCLSLPTIRTHISHIYKKLGINSKDELMALANNKNH